MHKAIRTIEGIMYAIEIHTKEDAKSAAKPAEDLETPPKVAPKLSKGDRVMKFERSCIRKNPYYIKHMIVKRAYASDTWMCSDSPEIDYGRIYKSEYLVPYSEEALRHMLHIARHINQTEVLNKKAKAKTRRLELKTARDEAKKKQLEIELKIKAANEFDSNGIEIASEAW